MKTPTNARRGFLVAGLAMPVAAVAAPVPAGGDDADLIALAERVVMAHRAYVGSYEPAAQSTEDERAREAEQDRLWAIAAELAEALMPMAPTTFAGFLAKGRAAHELAEKTTGGRLYASGVCNMLTASLLEDVARVQRRGDGMSRT
jgi:electron transfer flavoprotein alpha subunit